MSRTLVDVDDALLEAAAAELGTATKKDTINGALREVARRSAAAIELDRWRTGFYADALDETVMDGGWR